MRHAKIPACCALLLVVAPLRADILPEPDHGPAAASAAGLDFAIQSVSVKFPPGYSKEAQVVVLTDCTDGRPNCKLARSRHLIGMEVVSVDGRDLRPEIGMVQQIINAFATRSGGRTVTLELYSRASGGPSVKVAFEKR
jgi:hypothetical protein